MLMEALPLGQCDVVTSLDEAAALVRQIDHPAVRTMFDCHNAIDETEPHAALVERHYDLIRHVHVNELEAGIPAPALTISSRSSRSAPARVWRLDLAGGIRLHAGAETIARESLRYLESEIARLPT